MIWYGAGDLKIERSDILKRAVQLRKMQRQWVMSKNVI